MFDREEFEISKTEFAQAQNRDAGLLRVANEFMVRSDRYDYGYQWTWLGLPIIQMPEDIVITQDIIWKTTPDVIIETGIAWGGSIVLYASLLELIGKGEVIGIDRVLPEKNRQAITNYRFGNRITLIEGSSVDRKVVSQVKSRLVDNKSVMVLLDSNHTHEHVLSELRLYGPLVTRSQYLVVCDTIVEEIPRQTHRPRPWGQGNNPKTALLTYLNETDRFKVDGHVNAKLLTSYSPGGYLLCVK